MAARACKYSTHEKPCESNAMLLDGQRIYCERHHILALRTDKVYKSHVDAYNADPELVAAKAAYESAIFDAQSAAIYDVEKKASEHADIPLEERRAILITGKPGWAAKGKTLREICSPYGVISSVVIHCDKNGNPTGTTVIGFETHEQAARALSRLSGIECCGVKIKTSWAITHRYFQTPPPWAYEHVPAVQAAKQRFEEVLAAARERQEPGILAKEAAEAAEQRAKAAREAEEERRKQEYNWQEWAKRVLASKHNASSSAL